MSPRTATSLVTNRPLLLLLLPSANPLTHISLWHAPHPLAPPSPPLPPVKVKWGKEKLELEVDPSEPVETLRMQLYSITGVPAERQKIMCKKHWKGTLKDTDE